MRHHLVAGELPRGGLEGALLFGEVEIHGFGRPLPTGFSPAPLPPNSAGKWPERPPGTTPPRLQLTGRRGPVAPPPRGGTGAGQQKKPAQAPAPPRAFPHRPPRRRGGWDRPGGGGGLVGVAPGGCPRSRPNAPIITGRSPKGSWSATASAVPGITPASICAPARRCMRPALSPLACWKVEQRGGKIIVGAKIEQPAPRGRPSATPGTHRHRRWWRRGIRRGRDAAAAGVSRQHRHAEQRCRAAGRPAEPVEGLSRRQRAGGLAAAAPGRVLRRQQASTCDSRRR